jgi:cytochrome c biogenesis protein CcmG, thiol:disulfide interchange protein DsbE
VTTVVEVRRRRLEIEVLTDALHCTVHCHVMITLGLQGMRRAISDSSFRLTRIALRAGLGILASAWLASPIPSGADPVDLTALKGQVVYLDFWASWCAPCRESFPFMNHLQQTLAPQGLTVIAVNVDRNPADAEQFLRQHPAHFRVVFDSQGVLPEKFAVHGMPSSFVIDRNGIVQFRHEGFRLTDRDALEQQLRTWLARH